VLITVVETQNESLHFPPIPFPKLGPNTRPPLTPPPFHISLSPIVVAVSTVVANLVLCSLAGYAFARLRSWAHGLSSSSMATPWCLFRYDDPGSPDREDGLAFTSWPPWASTIWAR